MNSKVSLLLIVAALFFANFIAAAPAAANAGTQATFIRTDTTTQGQWKGVYGLGGYAIPDVDTNEVPGYVVFTPQNQANWTWSNATAPRALQVSWSSPTDVRQASCWYTFSSNSYDLDVNITDGNTHQFALYALDWDNKGRAETIQAVDGATGVVLDTRSLSNFGNGIYYIWNVSGHVKFNITLVSGPNAVISGAFFDIATANSTPGIAQFVTTDTSTQGNWHGTYGADGYTVVGDSQSAPSYAALTTLNQLSWTWTTSTTDQRALQQGAGSGRLAAAWYNAPTFSIDVNVTDGNSHQIALYALDWDSKGRGETFQVVDPQSGGVLDSRSIFSFANGIYLVWNVSGHVRINVTNTSGPNAVVSGVFFGGGSSGSSSITTSSVGSTSTGGVTTVKVTSSTGSGSATATFLQPQDTITEGNWIGKYGADGYSLASANQSLPAYAVMNAGASTTWTWANPTSDVRGLQLPPTGSSRIAATWYGPSSVALDINLTDGLQHEVSVYAIDWANKGQSQTFQVQDAATGTVLDTEPMPSFGNGAYLSWKIWGHVKIVATLNAGDNAVISGVFFGGSSGTPGNSTGGSNGASSASTAGNAPPPGTVTITLPVSISVTPSAITLSQSQIASFTVNVQNSTNQAVAWSISPNVGTISSAGIYTAPVAITSAQTVTVTATSAATQSASATATITLAAPVVTAAAHFFAADSSTHGTWIGKYGADGYSLASANQSLPAYAVMNAGASTTWTWANPTSDVRGLQLPPTGSSRIAATWYGPSSVALDINLTDGLQHEVSVYAIDWANKGQSQTFQVQDAVTGTVLDTEPMPSFGGGEYLSWNIEGHVKIVATLNAGDNAVISGVFFEASGSTQTTAQSQAATVQGYLSINPPSYNFGSVNIGSTISQTFEVSNSGAGSVTISNVSISGAGLNATGVPTGTVLTPGQSATLNVTFSPAASTGLTGGVTFTSNASDSSVALALTGTGVQPPPVVHSVVLTWGASSSAGVVGYDVYRGTVSGGPYTLLTTSPVSSTSYTDANGQPGQTYYYVVTSVDSSNMQSGYSNVVSATIP